MLQFLVDMGTDSKVLERTEEVAKRVAADNPRDFKSNVAVSAQIGSDKDPMKFYIQVYWCFTYNGDLPCCCPAQLAVLHGIDASCRDQKLKYLCPCSAPWRSHLHPCRTFRLWQVLQIILNFQ